MTFGMWLATFAYAALATALGHGALRLLRLHRAPLLGEWSACFLVGQMVLHAATLTTLLLPWSLRGMSPVLAAGGAAATLAFAREHWRARTLPRVLPAALLFAAAMLLFPNLLLSVHTTPTVEWDARSIWILHGKALHVHGGVDSAFFGNPRFWWSNLDYPLLLPAQAAWTAVIQGRWDEIGCKAFLWFQFAAWFHLAVTLLTRRWMPWFTAVPAVALAMVQGPPVLTAGFGYVSGLADQHYATPLVLALLALLAGEGRALWPFAIAMLTYAACTKNEATAYTAALGAAVAAAWVLRHRRALRMAARDLAVLRAPAVLAFALGVLPMVCWRLYSRAQPIPGGLNLDRQVTMLPELLAARAPTVLRFFFERHLLAGAHWLLLAWVLLAAAGALRRRRPGLGRADALLLAALLAVHALIAVTFVLTPHDYVMHMQMALGRLLALPQLLLCALCALRLRHLLQADARPHAPRPGTLSTAAAAGSAGAAGLDR
ncbi:MAG: hypothetical protein AB7O97_22275 [Planctomycetota bacterium]